MDVVRAVPARLSASPDGSAAEPDGSKSTVAGTPNGIRSSPPTILKDVTMVTDLQNVPIAYSGGKSDSEAETIVLPGKDGHSPSKIRKLIKHEDKSEDEDEEMKNAPADVLSVVRDSGGGVGIVVGVKGETKTNPGESISGATATSLGKRKRRHGLEAGNSSGLSSAPTSPVATTRSSLSKHVNSDNSEGSRSPSPRLRARSAIRDKTKSIDGALSRKNHYVSGSGDEDHSENQRFRRQRSSDHRSSRDVGPPSKPNNDFNSRKRSRSISPPSRSHKRSISTQLPSKPPHGLSHKKKRIPAPLQSTEYHSDSSSASGTSHPRSSRVRYLAAPVTGESTVSPARMAPHKKHVNASGQTPLAIAVQRGLLENVKLRYEERHSDLNLADNALNTPLHVASLNGFTDIVRFLLDTGDCELDSVNVDKDTPLHDAVDNGHLEVVKLLLDAGANPSKPNKAGNEALDIVNEKGDEDEEDSEMWAEMKSVILAAKRSSTTEHHRGSEDHQMRDSDSRMSHAKESPRETPPVPTAESQNYGTMNRKMGTARSLNKTRDTTLYQPLDVTELRTAARDGDASTVSRILDIMSNVNDAQTLYNAVKGGHEAIVNFLFAMGNFDPDPDPRALEGLPLEQATPILAAIGKDNHLEVIKLILAQSGFNPTKTYKNETYSQIAVRRAGPRWQEEEQLLRKAYDDYKRTHKSNNKSRSPTNRRDGRDTEQVAKRLESREEQHASRPHQRSNSNPKSRDPEHNKTVHKNSSSTTVHKEGQGAFKRGPGRPKKEESASSDRETSPLGPPRQKVATKKQESDVAVTSETEPTAKPRRKLVSGKELRGERELERQRRASVTSNASGASVKENRDRPQTDSKADKPDGKSSPSVSRISKNQIPPLGEKDSTSDKHSSEKDRARSLKRDDSKDRLSAIRGDSPVKRPHKSETPPRSNMQEVYPHKKRKLDSDAVSHKTDSTPSSSPEARSGISKVNLSRDSSSSKSSSDSKPKKVRPSDSDQSRDAASTEKHYSDRHTKSVNPTHATSSENTVKKTKYASDRLSKQSSDEHVSSAKAEEEAQKQAKIRRERKEAEATKQKELEEERIREEARQARQKEVEEERQKEEARKAREKEAEEERAREREREAEEARLEQARLAKEEREKAAREEEEQRQREEAERKERQRREDAEAHNRAVEQQKALYLEQERLKREEQERRRAQQIEAQRAERARLEQQRNEERLARLPLLLKWFDQMSDPRTPDIANLFKGITGFRYDTINPEATSVAAGREQWMLNYHVAILLGEKDLQLSRCK